MHTLLEVTAKTTAVLLAAGWINRLLGGSSAAIRHLVGMAAIVIILILPTVALFGPTWQLRILSPASRLETPEPLQSSSSTRQSAQIEPASIPTPTKSSTALSPIQPSRLNASQLVLGIWLVGFVFGLLRLSAGMVSVARVARQGRPADTEDWNRILEDAAISVKLDTQVPLLISDQMGVPGVCGLFRQKLLLPADAVQWTAARRRLVLLHELAHVKRRDCLAQVIAQFAYALHWFNPFAFLAAKRLREDQERACDDLVLKSGASAPEYAKHLLEIALASRPRRLWDGATVAMARSSKLGYRVVAILDRNRSRRAPSSGLTAFVAVIALVVTPLGAMRLATRLQPVAEQITAVRPTVNSGLPAIPTTTSASESKPDFTGTWKLQSGNGAWPFGQYETWVIRQTATEFTLDASGANRDPDHTTYYFDRWAKKWDSDWMHGIGRAQWDGSRLVTAFGDDTGGVNNPWIFQLSPDGRSIRADAIQLNGMGLSFDFREASISQVYVRQRSVYAKVSSK